MNRRNTDKFDLLETRYVLALVSTYGFTHLIRITAILGQTYLYEGQKFLQGDENRKKITDQVQYDEEKSKTLWNNGNRN